MHSPPRLLWLAPAALLLAGAASAQEEPTGREAPRQPQDTAQVADTVRLGPPTLTYTPTRFSFALSLGTPGSGELQIQPVEAVLSITGLARDTALFLRTVQLRGQARIALDAAWNTASGWGVRVGAGYSVSRLEASLKDSDDFFAITPTARPARTADIRALHVEVAGRYWIPSSRSFRPYLELGAGLTRWSGEGALAEAEVLAGGVTRAEVLTGVGAVLPLTPRFSAHFRASNRLFPTPVRPWTAGDTLVDGAALLVTARESGANAFADAAREALRTTRLEVGLSVDVQRPRAPARPEDLPAADEPPSPSDR